MSDASVTAQTARELITERFDSNWTATDVATTVRYDNETLRNSAAPWLRVAIRHQGSDQLTMGPTGTRRFRRRANLVIQVFVPAGDREGMERLDILAHAARRLFEGVYLSGLTFQAGAYQEIGFDGRAWCQGNVVIPFWYCEIA